MSDEKLLSTLHELVKNESSLEAKWNRMHTMHCVLCSVDSRSAQVEDFLLTNHLTLVNLKVSFLLTLNIADVLLQV